MRQTVRNIVAGISPYDDLESEHISDALQWIDSDIEIFRIEKPATPPKHLVSYFVVFDPHKKKIMLIDHIKAELWLPAGGHVEKDEDPKETVRRELQEELALKADFVFDEPIFLTQAMTVGKTAGHTDVSLWYVVAADSDQTITYDTSECNGYRWFTFEEILSFPLAQLDPHLHRFAQKLRTLL